MILYYIPISCLWTLLIVWSMKLILQAVLLHVSKTQSKVIRQLNNLRIYQTDHFDLIISGFWDDNNSKTIQTKQDVLDVIFRRGRKAIILNCSNISFYIYPDHYNVCNAFFRDAFTIWKHLTIKCIWVHLVLEPIRLCKNTPICIQIWLFKVGIAGLFCKIKTPFLLTMKCH